MFDKRNCEKRYDFYSIKKRREEKFTFQLKSHFQSRKMICEQRERKSERQRKKSNATCSHKLSRNILSLGNGNKSNSHVLVNWWTNHNYMLSRNSETRSTYYIFLCCYAFGIAFAYFLDVVALFVCCFVLFLCVWFEPREIVLTTYFTCFKSLLNDDGLSNMCVL